MEGVDFIGVRRITYTEPASSRIVLRLSAAGDPRPPCIDLCLQMIGYLGWFSFGDCLAKCVASPEQDCRSFSQYIDWSHGPCCIQCISYFLMSCGVNGIDQRLASLMAMLGGSQYGSCTKDF